MDSNKLVLEKAERFASKDNTKEATKYV